MKRNKHWTRRDFLRAAGVSAGAALLSPLLPTLSTEAHAQTAAGAKRFLFITTGNGVILPQWRSNGTGTPLTPNAALPQLMGPILAPLDPYRSNMLLLDGLDFSSCYQTNVQDSRSWRRVGNTGHGAATVTWTGRVVADDVMPDGPSIDWLINQHLSDGRTMLTISTDPGPNGTGQPSTFDDNGTPLLSQAHPPTAFDSVFGPDFTAPTDAGEADRRLSRRTSALALLRGDIARLKTELPTVDRERLDVHLDKLNGLEQRLQAAYQPVVCDVSGANRPVEPSPKFFENRADETIEAMGETVAAAFACDQVRVASWALTPESSWRVPQSITEIHNSFLADNDLHPITHLTQGTSSTAAEAQRLVTAYNRWCAEKVAWILETLSQYGVLEDTVVVWAMNHCHPGVHSNRSCPHVIIQGSDAGPFDANRYVKFGDFTAGDGVCSDSNDCDRYAGGMPHNNLLLTLAQSCGLALNTIGNPEHCTAGGLNDLLLR